MIQKLLSSIEMLYVCYTKTQSISVKKRPYILISKLGASCETKTEIAVLARFVTTLTSQDVTYIFFTKSSAKALVNGYFCLYHYLPSKIKNVQNVFNLFLSFSVQKQ